MAETLSWSGPDGWRHALRADTLDDDRSVCGQVTYATGWAMHAARPSCPACIAKLGTDSKEQPISLSPTGELALTLIEQGWTPPPPVPAPNLCSLCGSDDYYMTDITVIVADGEEGFARVRQYRCEDHLEVLLDAIRDLGFTDHRHGSISLLEEPACPGSIGADCPTPSEYGLHVIEPARHG